MKTNDLLDRVKREYRLTSDYQLAKKLDISRSRVSQYRTTSQTMNDELVLVIEKLLKLPPGSILLEMHAERTKCKDAAKILHDLSVKMMSTAAAVLLSVSVTYSDLSAPQHAPALTYLAMQQCILCKIKNSLIYSPRFLVNFSPVRIIVLFLKTPINLQLYDNTKKREIHNYNLWVLS